MIISELHLFTESEKNMHWTYNQQQCVYWDIEKEENAVGLPVDL